MQQDTPIILPSVNADGLKTQDTNMPKIIAIVTSAVAICGIGFGIYEIVQNNNANARISDLESEITSLRKQLEEKTPTSPEDNSASSGSNSNQSKPNHAVVTKKYLEPQGRDVRFAYPEGVTDVQYDVQDANWDGVLYVSGITKDGKTYDVNLFGGKDNYKHYPFSLGAVARLSTTSSPSGWVANAPLLFENNNYKYYKDGGNGYETGDAAEYEEACRIVEVLFNNIETK